MPGVMPLEVAFEMYLLYEEIHTRNRAFLRGEQRRGVHCPSNVLRAADAELRQGQLARLGRELHAGRLDILVRGQVRGELEAGQLRAVVAVGESLLKGRGDRAQGDHQCRWR